MSIAGRIRSSVVCLSSIAAATLMAGCGGVAVFDQAAADQHALDRINDIKIEVTTISGVANESYPQAAWLNVNRNTTHPYSPMTMGQIFEWKFLDELAAEQGSYEVTARGKRVLKEKPKKAREPKKSKKREKAPPKKKVEAKEVETPAEDKVEPELDEEKTEPEAEEEPAPGARRRRRRM